MTAPAAGAAGQPRRAGRLMKVALALSVALNIFFIGGLVYSKIAGERWLTPNQRVEALARRLELTQEQRAPFQNLVQTIRSKGQALRAANQKLALQAWDELAKPQPDQARLAQIFGEVADNRRQFQTDVGNAMRSFLVTLNPDQRRQFIEVAKRRRDEMAHRLRHLGLP